MKTPRDILFERHGAANAKLDAMRHETVANLSERSLDGQVGADERGSARRRPSALRIFLLSVRWHLAGLGAAWLVVLLLNIDRASGPPSAQVAAHILSASQLMAAVKENRRQERE